MARIHTYVSDSSITGSEKLLGTDAGTTKLFSLSDLKSYFTTSTAAGTTFTGDIVPNADDSLDIGSSSAQWQDLYIDGIAYIDQIGTDGDPTSTAYIAGGEIDGTVIGGESAAAGTFTTVTAATINATSALQIGGTALSLNHLSDVLVADSSLYLGHDPTSTDDTAQYNIAVGATALDAITTGDSNTAVGYNALTACQSGAGNIAIGYTALDSITSSSYAIAIGHAAGAAITTEDTKSIFIGFNAGTACLLYTSPSPRDS